MLLQEVDKNVNMVNGVVKMTCRYLEIFDHPLMVSDCWTDDRSVIGENARGVTSAATCGAVAFAGMTSTSKCRKRKNPYYVDSNCWKLNSGSKQHE